MIFKDFLILSMETSLAGQNRVSDHTFSQFIFYIYLFLKIKKLMQKNYQQIQHEEERQNQTEPNNIL